MFISGLGAVFFGLVIGWISYRTLRLTTGANLISAIAIIIAVVGGAAVTLLLRSNVSDVLFGWYAIGLAVGFFAYFGVGLRLYGMQEVQLWRMPPATSPISPPDANPTDVISPPDANPTDVAHGE